jgi:hypothetical protein
VTDDRSQARSEAAALLNVDIEHMSPADGLRVDMISALRLVIDHEQASVLSGGSADLGKLNVAVQSLIALLPGSELPAPERDDHPDPRKEMFRVYMEMRTRGEVPPEGHFQHRIGELEAENAELRARLGLAPANPTLTTVLDAPKALPVIDPPTSAITPPSEWRGVPPMSGPDDPPRRSSQVIEGKAVKRPDPPATPAKPAWEVWLDAGGYGGPGYDRWSNRNIP